MDNITLKYVVWDLKENDTDESVEDKPDFDDIEDAIILAEDEEAVDIMIKNGENESMDISGGGGNLCLTISYIDQGRYLRLKNPNAAEGLQDIIIGGQRVQYEKSLIVPISLTLQAAEYYFHNKMPDPNLSWKE